MKMPICVPSSHHCSVIPSCISKAIFAAFMRGVILCVFVLSLCLTPEPARAQLSQLSDENLSGISGQAGVSIVMNGSAQFYFETLKFSDTQATPNWIGLHNFSVTGSLTGGDFSFATLGADVSSGPAQLMTNFLAYYASDPIKSTYTWYNNYNVILTDPKVTDGTIVGLDQTLLVPNTIDIVNDGSKTYIEIVNTSHMNPRWYKGNLFFENGITEVEQALGSLELDELRQGPSVSRIWAHAASGISFDYTTTISAGGLIYTYNTTTSEALSFSKIHIAGSATGSETTPSSWGFSGTFKIGTIGDASNAPATIDVGTNAGVTSLSLNLPMAGTFRVEDVIFGTNTLSSDPNFNSNFAEGDPLNFGPIAIDGIKVHHLNVKISGAP